MVIVSPAVLSAVAESIEVAVLSALLTDAWTRECRILVINHWQRNFMVVLLVMHCLDVDCFINMCWDVGVTYGLVCDNIVLWRWCLLCCVLYTSVAMTCAYLTSMYMSLRFSAGKTCISVTGLTFPTEFNGGDRRAVGCVYCQIQSWVNI